MSAMRFFSRESFDSSGFFAIWIVSGSMGMEWGGPAWFRRFGSWDLGVVGTWNLARGSQWNGQAALRE